MNKKLSIIAITTLALVIGGLAIVPAVEQQQAHALLLKDSAGKVKKLIKNVVSKIFNRGGGDECPTCG
jgi:hypothetical protein